MLLPLNSLHKHFLFTDIIPVTYVHVTCTVHVHVTCTVHIHVHVHVVHVALKVHAQTAQYML